MYSGDSNDYLAPLLGRNLTGPDNWVYATSNNGRIPGEPSARDLQRDTTSIRLRSNVKWRFRISQLGTYIGDQKALWCPKDICTIEIERPLVGTSGQTVLLLLEWHHWCYNNIGKPSLGGKTYKTTNFNPTDWQLWEQMGVSLNFNDASNMPPGNTGNGISIRHAGVLGGRITPMGIVADNLPGGPVGSLVGR